MPRPTRPIMLRTRSPRFPWMRTKPIQLWSASSDRSTHRVSRRRQRRGPRTTTEQARNLKKALLLLSHPKQEAGSSSRRRRVHRPFRYPSDPRRPLNILNTMIFIIAPERHHLEAQLASSEANPPRCLAQLSVRTVPRTLLKSCGSSGIWGSPMRDAMQ